MAFQTLKPNDVVAATGLDGAIGTLAQNDPNAFDLINDTFVAWAPGFNSPGAVADPTYFTSDGAGDILSYNGQSTNFLASATIGFEDLRDYGSAFIDLTAGATQVFRVVLKRNADATGTGQGNNPNDVGFNIGLRLNGGTTNIVTSPTFICNSAATTGQYYEFAWNGNLVNNVYGTGVECHIQQTSGGQSGGAVERRRWFEVMAVEWYADTINIDPYRPRSYSYLT